MHVSESREERSCDATYLLHFLVFIFAFCDLNSCNLMGILFCIFPLTRRYVSGGKVELSRVG